MTRETVIAAILGFVRVSPAPEPPLGAPESVRIFRAGKNHYYVKLLAWGLVQIGASIGLLFSIGFVTSLQLGTRAIVAHGSRPTTTASPTAGPATSLSPDTQGPASPPPVAPASPSPASSVPAPSRSATAGVAAPPDWPAPPPSTASPEARRARNRVARTAMARLMNRLPTWRYFPIFVNYVLPFLVFLEYVGVATFLFLFVATYFMARLEYEQHWYIVTDRSLRIRTGVLSLSESTMSFANIQQVEVKQGPVQSLLGLADVRVQSAGGGSSEREPGHDPLHSGIFHNVENAAEIRDLILARLRAFRETGLGDPTEARAASAPGAPAAGARATLLPALDAARELVSEARALRAALAPGTAASSATAAHGAAEGLREPDVDP